MRLIEKIIQVVTNNPVVYDLVQTVLEGDYHGVIADTVAQENEETILEIGCGTGYFGQFFRNYTGIDIDPAYIEGAKARGLKTHQFEVGDATKLPYTDKSFDKVMIINVIHHLSDNEVRVVLKEAKRLAKKQVYIFDMTTDKNTFITPLLLSLDNGKFIRPLSEQLALARETFAVEKSFTFVPPRKLLSHSAILCPI